MLADSRHDERIDLASPIVARDEDVAPLPRTTRQEAGHGRANHMRDIAGHRMVEATMLCTGMRTWPVLT